jgi:ketosteroid isomerase-like protein
MVRRVALLPLMLLFVAGWSVFQSRADDADTIAAINASSNAPYEAFTKKDVATIKALMTEDHLTVTPYYDGPQTVDDQLASLDKYDWSQTIVCEPDVALLGPDVTLRTFSAELKGIFQGKPLPPRVFATELLVKRDGKWVERFYQVTTLEP